MRFRGTIRWLASDRGDGTYLSTQVLQSLPPGVAVLGQNAERRAARAAGSMRREMAGRQRRLRLEQEQHVRLADAEEGVAIGIFIDDRQAEHLGVEPLKGGEIVAVETGFHDGEDRQLRVRHRQPR